MKKKMKSKLMAVVVSLAMVFTMMPMMNAPVYADDPAPAEPSIATGPDVLSIGSNTSGAATVHMAGKTWRVIGYGAGTEQNPQVASSAGTMTLIAAGNLKTGVQFNPISNQVNTYKGSNLYNEVNALTDDTNGIFSKGEKEGMVPRDLKPGGYTGQAPYTNGIAGDEVKGALLWPLSTQEAYYMDENLRAMSAHWWLRSPGEINEYAALVGDVGTVDVGGMYVRSGIYGVRPAFNFNLKSVIFTSAAAGGKSSGTVGADSLTQIGDNVANEWKLTVGDEAHEDFVVDSVKTCDGKTLDIKYSKAMEGENEYISAIIKSSGGDIKYYGRLALASKEDGSTAKVNTDGKLADSDTLVIFNEQFNGDYKNEGGAETAAKTDFASPLREVEIPTTYHDLTKEDKVEPTCTTPGTKGYWKCKDCAEMFADKDGKTKITEPEEISAIGHKYGEWTNFDANQHQGVCEHDKSYVVKENHKWDAGKETKKATEKATGVKTYTCTVCKATKNETIPKLTPTPKPPTPKVSKQPSVKIKAGKKSLTLGWNKIKGVAGYDIFFARCNHSHKNTVCRKVKNIKGNNIFTWKKSGLKKGIAYKSYVKAYVMKNGKKKYVFTSPVMHAYTGNGNKKYTNAKSVSLKNVKKGKLTLKKGKTFKIKAKVKKVNKKKKLMPKGHAPTLRYMTSDKKIATVSSKGKIKAAAKGKCNVYAYAHNGVCKKIKVTVK